RAQCRSPVTISMLVLRTLCHFSPMHRPPPRSTPFPYTTLFRSLGAGRQLPAKYAELLQGLEQHIGSQCKQQAGKYLTQFVHGQRSEEHTSELQSRENLVCRLLLEKKKRKSEKVSGSG